MIPYGRQDITQADTEAVSIRQSDYFMQKVKTHRFERSFPNVQGHQAESVMRASSEGDK